MYRFYNNNALGLFKNDCTIRAISCAERKSWDETYDKMSDLAQAKGTMMVDKNFIIDYLDANYKRVPYVYETVGQTAAAYPDKTLLITMFGHITCARNGLVLDSFDPRMRTTENAWIIE